MKQTPSPSSGDQSKSPVSKSKTLAALMVILALVLIILVVSDQRKNQEASMPKQNIEQTDSLETSPDATDSAGIDNLTDDIIKDYAKDSAIVEQGNEDVQYLYDSESIINVEGIYNENEF